MKIFAYFAASLLLVGMSACREKAKEGSTEKEIVDVIRLSDLEGNAIDLKKYQGKALFINVWATWCKPCIEEMPSIKNAQTILKGSGIEFLFASNEGKERIESFESKRKFELHYVQLENLEELQIPALPVTYIINSRGQLVFSEAGYRPWDSAENIELLTKIIDDHE